MATETNVTRTFNPDGTYSDVVETVTVPDPVAPEPDPADVLAVLLAKLETATSLAQVRAAAVAASNL